jgi:hypothetical protein
MSTSGRTVPASKQKIAQLETAKAQIECEEENDDR